MFGENDKRGGVRSKWAPMPKLVLLRGRHVPRARKIIMLVGRDECQAYLTGKPGCSVEAPSPFLAYHVLYVFCMHERVTPREIQLDIDPAAPPQRKSAARRATGWIEKLLKIA